MSLSIAEESRGENGKWVSENEKVFAEGFLIHLFNNVFKQFVESKPDSVKIYKTGIWIQWLNPQKKDSLSYMEKQNKGKNKMDEFKYFGKHKIGDLSIWTDPMSY